MHRRFSSFEYRDANYRLSSPDDSSLFKIIRRLRNRLEEYIAGNPEFGGSLVPLPGLAQPAPESAQRMHRASLAAGVGPMAAVAGTFAQLAAEEYLRQFPAPPTGPSDSSSPASSSTSSEPARENHPEIIVENGGDIFAVLNAPLIIGLWVGPDSPFKDLALRILPGPGIFGSMAICSSSSTMGHSYSKGSCDLVTVFSPDASLADACATAVCNRITSTETLQDAVEWGTSLENVKGVLAIRGGKLALAGEIPQLLRHAERDLDGKITRHRDSSFRKNQ